MKNLIFLLCICISNENTYTTILPPAKPGTIEEKWENFCKHRMDTLEKKYGILFSEHWEPRIKFERPSYITSGDFSGCYDQASHAIWISSFYKYIKWESTDTIQIAPVWARELIDHELGHALCDQISVLNFGKTWPDTLTWIERSFEEKVALKILTEGVAEYFSNSNTTTEISFQLFPDNKKNTIWKNNEWTYSAGYILVKPIVTEFGEKGLKYIIQNSFTYKDGDVRTAAKAYQKTALEELSKR